jgi:NADH dehydrogenase (ubiquinone) flavoprotein 2
MGSFVNHRDTEDNLEETPFEFTEHSYELIYEKLTHFPDNYKHSACIPVLFIAQKQNNNFLTLSAMNKVAKILEMEPMQVYEVASFYTMFNRTKPGTYHLQFCGTTPCMIRGARECMDAIKDFTGVGMNETSADGLFTLTEVECLGACVNAPMMQVNNEWFYEDLTPENTVEILKKWKAGVEPEVGPQCGTRINSIGPMGRTSLETIPNSTFDRDFAQVKEDYEKAKAEAAKK